MKQNFTSEARKAIEAAGRTARYCRQNYIGTEHLLVGLLTAVQGTAAYVLQDAGVTKEKLMQLIDSLITPQSSVALMDDAEYSPRAESALRDAVRLADQFRSDEPGTEHILLAAEEQGLGACWCHIYGRAESEAMVRNLTGIPEKYNVLCVIALGYKNEQRKDYDLAKLLYAKIHNEQF